MSVIVTDQLGNTGLKTRFKFEFLGQHPLALSSS